MNNKAYEIKDENLIQELIDNVEYGTLALCVDNKPYSLPLNFAEFGKKIYFHGSKKGKKVDIMKKNPYASFSIIEDFSLLPSYFSTEKEIACPATHLYKSLIIDGKIEFIQDYNEKANALEALMQKLQKEGQYIPLSNKEVYEKMVKATEVYKLIPKQKTAKFHFSQKFNKQRYEMVVEHLKQRGTKKDLATLKLVEEFKK